MTDLTIWSIGLFIVIFLAFAVLALLVTDHIYKRDLKDKYDQID